jgi:hypothetical protein
MYILWKNEFIPGKDFFALIHQCEKPVSLHLWYTRSPLKLRKMGAEMITVSCFKMLIFCVTHKVYFVNEGKLMQGLIHTN